MTEDDGHDAPLSIYNIGGGAVLILSYGLTRASLSDKLQSPSLFVFMLIWGLISKQNLFT
ncbi:hypothetical protein [Dysgonomonas macrotermitis]|uniref:Uncharacterized protein n=1 Tax=Dysgonomonas macrotermitis TaxID=1346286 RepID=A0A1M5DCK4_9BACT|nr:hypothetical protein [Dysgonomonas macrotermitis]SHF64676.1 hypothetical protein SAMN05444362_108150 [Dysgonomonas macrotermitis]